MSDLTCNITLEPALTVNVELNAIGATSYTLLPATASVLGGVKQGSGVSIDVNGVLSAAGTYTLPVATGSVLGGVKDGDRITIAADGTISADVQTTDISGKVDKVTGSSLVADTEISKIHASGSDNQDLSNLVVKVTGSSLVADTEISKIHASGSDNQDLSGLTTAPATNTADYIPQWNGANSKTLKDGLPVPSGGLVGLDSDEIEFAIINSYRI
jgi:hypothetical protein